MSIIAWPQRKKGPGTGDPEAMTDCQIAEYVQDMSDELSGMCKGVRLQGIAACLTLAAEEARRVVSDSQKT